MKIPEMVASCCAPKCTNQFKVGVKLYRFPVNAVRRAQWIAAINRTDWTPTEWSRLCNAHFIDGQKSNNPKLPNYIPTIFHHVEPSSSGTSSGTLSDKKEVIDLTKRVTSTNCTSTSRAAIPVHRQKSADPSGPHKKIFAYFYCQEHSLTQAPDTCECVQSKSYADSLPIIRIKPQKETMRMLIENESTMSSVFGRIIISDILSAINTTGFIEPVRIYVEADTEPNPSTREKKPQTESIVINSTSDQPRSNQPVKRQPVKNKPTKKPRLGPATGRKSVTNKNQAGGVQQKAKLRGKSIPRTVYLPHYNEADFPMPWPKVDLGKKFSMTAGKRVRVQTTATAAVSRKRVASKAAVSLLKPDIPANSNIMPKRERKTAAVISNTRKFDFFGNKSTTNTSNFGLRRKKRQIKFSEKYMEYRNDQENFDKIGRSAPVREARKRKSMDDAFSDSTEKKQKRTSTVKQKNVLQHSDNRQHLSAGDCSNEPARTASSSLHNSTRQNQRKKLLSTRKLQKPAQKHKNLPQMPTNRQTRKPKKVHRKLKSQRNLSSTEIFRSKRTIHPPLRFVDESFLSSAELLSHKRDNSYMSTLRLLDCEDPLMEQLNTSAPVSGVIFGMRSCFVPGCLNSDGLRLNWLLTNCDVHDVPHHSPQCTCQSPHDFKFFHLPIQVAKKYMKHHQEWLCRIGMLRDSEVKEYQRVCSDHFVEDRPTAKHPYPTVNIHNVSSVINNLAIDVQIKQEPIDIEISPGGTMLSDYNSPNTSVVQEDQKMSSYGNASSPCVFEGHLGTLSTSDPSWDYSDDNMICSQSFDDSSAGHTEVIAIEPSPNVGILEESEMSLSEKHDWDDKITVVDPMISTEHCYIRKNANVGHSIEAAIGFSKFLVYILLNMNRKLKSTVNALTEQNESLLAKLKENGISHDIFVAAPKYETAATDDATSDQIGVKSERGPSAGDAKTSLNDIQVIPPDVLQEEYSDCKPDDADVMDAVEGGPDISQSFVITDHRFCKETKDAAANESQTQEDVNKVQSVATSDDCTPEDIDNEVIERHKKTDCGSDTDTAEPCEDYVEDSSFLSNSWDTPSAEGIRSSTEYPEDSKVNGILGAALGTHCDSVDSLHATDTLLVATEYDSVDGGDDAKGKVPEHMIKVKDEHVDTEKLQDVNQSEHMDTKELQDVNQSEHVGTEELRDINSYEHVYTEELHDVNQSEHGNIEEIEDVNKSEHMDTEELRDINSCEHVDTEEIENVNQSTTEELQDVNQSEHGNIEEIEDVNKSVHMDTEELRDIYSCEHVDTEEIENMNHSEHVDTEELQDVNQFEHVNTDKLQHVNQFEHVDAEELQDVNQSEQMDTEELQDINSCEHVDTEEIEDVNQSEHVDTKEIENVKLSGHVDTEDLQHVDQSEHVGTEELQDGNTSEHVDDKELQDINQSEHVDTEELQYVNTLEQVDHGELQNLKSHEHLKHKELQIFNPEYCGNKELKQQHDAGIIPNVAGEDVEHFNFVELNNEHVNTMEQINCSNNEHEQNTDNQDTCDERVANKPVEHQCDVNELQRKEWSEHLGSHQMEEKHDRCELVNSEPPARVEDEHVVKEGVAHVNSVQLNHINDNCRTQKMSEEFECLKENRDVDVTHNTSVGDADPDDFTSKQPTHESSMEIEHCNEFYIPNEHHPHSTDPGHHSDVVRPALPAASSCGAELDVGMNAADNSAVAYNDADSGHVNKNDAEIDATESQVDSIPLDSSCVGHGVEHGDEEVMRPQNLIEDNLIDAAVMGTFLVTEEQLDGVHTANVYSTT